MIVNKWKKFKKSGDRLTPKGVNLLSRIKKKLIHDSK